MREKKVWHRVVAPRAWYPKEGDELVGEYLGTEVKAGKFGEYKIHVVRVRAGDIRYVSGTVVDDLFKIVEVGARVKVVFGGLQKSNDGDKVYKCFELYTEEAVEFKVLKTA